MSNLDDGDLNADGKSGLACESVAQFGWQVVDLLLTTRVEPREGRRSDNVVFIEKKARLAHPGHRDGVDPGGWVTGCLGQSASDRIE
ncbi:unannotated protein [freshwater metagenome]|uniref:Unannotated protein n=1 Tax=freshwater metagenome TaxID=449393 RepID=A0A6J7FBU4_9ZZZZ